MIVVASTPSLPVVSSARQRSGVCVGTRLLERFDVFYSVRFDLRELQAVFVVVIFYPVGLWCYWCSLHDPIGVFLRPSCCFCWRAALAHFGLRPVGAALLTAVCVVVCGAPLLHTNVAVGVPRCVARHILSVERHYSAFTSVGVISNFHHD